MFKLKMTGVIVTLVSLFLLAGFSGCASLTTGTRPPMPSWDETEKDGIQEAFTHFAFASLAAIEGNYQESIGYLRKALEQDPLSGYLHGKMALVLKNMKAYDDALIHALKSIELEPENPGNRIILADIYALKGQNDLALQSYREALDLNPDNQRIRLLLATILIRKGALEKALGHLDVLLDSNPEIIIAHYYRGRIYLEMQRLEEAEAALLEALKRNNTLEPALFDLGTLYQMTKRPLKAAEVYEKLLTLHPDKSIVRERLLNLYLKLDRKEDLEKHMDAIKDRSKQGEQGRQLLGLIYLRQGRLDESIEELDMIVSIRPEDDKSRYYLATAYEEKGETEKALEHFSAIKPESDFFIGAQKHITYLLNAQKRYDEAISSLEKALALKKGHSDLHLLLGSVYEARGDYEKGMETLKTGLQKDAENLELLFRYGVLLDKTGDKDACIDQMNKILELDPKHADALNYIGYTYADRGERLDEAKAMIQKALAIKPGSGYIIDSLGWVCYQQGAYDEALHHLEKAVKLLPEDPIINEHLGDVYAKKGAYKKALIYYRKALSLKDEENDRLKQKIADMERILPEVL